ncbi:PSP1 C-terminal domain-containing protein [Mycena kentingensis (nom. inval.)]|nr:PSP1 C-terminal domain-containing protein [Mycena kentingensis (nom. inval.)]
MQPDDTRDDDRRFRQPQQQPAHGGHRAASQPPHPATPSPAAFASPQLPPAPLGAGAGQGWNAGGGNGHPQHAHIMSSATRSTSFSSGRFGSTFEDDELVDPGDELYDAHYGSYGQAQYRGRPPAGPPDVSRSRSHSLATAPVGSGRSPSASSHSSSHGYNPNAGIGSAANSYVTSNLYGNNAYAGHNNLYPGGNGRYGSLGGGASALRERREENTSPFMRAHDVGALDGSGSSFRELWERNRRGGSGVGMAHSLSQSYGYRERERDLLGRAGRFDEYTDDYGYDDDEDYPYLESGATSRRHSVSGAVGVPIRPQLDQPRARMTGFAAPESSGTSLDNVQGGLGGSGFRRGGGGLLLSDDDLEGALGSLSLNTNAGPAPQQYPGAGNGHQSPLSPRARYNEPAPSKDWADAYFSPPQHPPSPLRARAPSAASNSGAGPLSPVMGPGAGRGFGGPQPQPQYNAGPGQPHQQGHPQHLPPQQHAPAPAVAPPMADLGKGIPLHAVPNDWPLYIVEFKAGRTDLFYLPPKGKRGEDLDPSNIRVGDLVIVEADRGKDLGKVINDSITIGEVEAYWAGKGTQSQSPPTSPGGHGDAGPGAGGKKEISPKLIYGKAGPGDAQLLVAKMQDELKALQLCQTKVRAKKLPMEVVDAEYQWDRRKLTFYFVAEKRIDFRELVRELFRLYKTRIWMASLAGASGMGGGGYEA